MATATDLPLLSAEAARRWVREEGHRMTGHGRWFLGGEPNVQTAEEILAAPLRILVARLSSYDDVALSITHGFLGQLARLVPGAGVDYAYLPPPRDRRLFRTAGLAPWTGTTTKAPPHAFHLLAVSNSIAQELVNLPALLVESGVPAWKAERMADPACPLVLFGGNNAAAAAVIHGDSAGGNGGGFVDAAIIGEAEEAFPRFLALMAEAMARGAGKAGILEAAHGRVPGFYEPDRYRHVHGQVPAGGPARLLAIEPDPEVEFPVRRVAVPRLDPAPLNVELPVPYDEAAAGRSQLPIDLGCPCFCNFCREGFEVGPYRERSPAAFLEGLRRAKRAQGLHAVDLQSYNFNMHARFYEILEGALGLVDSVWMKSQRFDILAEDPGMAGRQHEAGKGSFTCGLEGISERLRRFLHKNLTREQILEAAAGIFAAPARELKIFLIATGREEESDLREWEELLGALVARRGAARTRIIVSLTPLLPMPNTPSQFLAALPAPDGGDPVVAAIGKACARHGSEFRTAIDAEEAEIAHYLLRGDRRVAPALLRLSRDDGIVFGRGFPRGSARRFRERLREAGVDPGVLLEARGPLDPLPWDDIHTGTPKAWLWMKHEESLRHVETEYCLDRRTVRGHCFRCDACTTPEQVRAIVRREIGPAPPPGRLARLRERRRDPLRMRFTLEVAEELAPAPVRFRQVALARALLLADEDLVEAYLRPGAAWDPGPGRLPHSGRSALDLLFLRGTDPARVAAAAQAAAPHLRGLRVLDLEQARTPAPVAEEVELRLRPRRAVAVEAWRAEIGRALHRSGVRHTETRRPQGRDFAPAGRNRLGLLHLELAEGDAGAVLRVRLDGRGDPARAAAILVPGAVPRVEITELRLAQGSASGWRDEETEERDPG
jgi:radical SAM superfamily enzyme YgiQ (UPF0313 family)